MYVEVAPSRGSPPTILLREGRREGSKVRKRTLANLSAWAPALLDRSASPQRSAVLAMIAQRLLRPASKLTTTRLWHSTTLAAELALEHADEGHLYAAMDWLLEHQDCIQRRQARRPDRRLRPAGRRRSSRSPRRHDQHRRGAPPGPRPEHRPEIRDPGPLVQRDHDDFERERATPEIELGLAVSDGDAAVIEMAEHMRAAVPGRPRRGSESS